MAAALPQDVDAFPSAGANDADLADAHEVDQYVAAIYWVRRCRMWSRHMGIAWLSLLCSTVCDDHDAESSRNAHVTALAFGGGPLCSRLPAHL